MKLELLVIAFLPSPRWSSYPHGSSSSPTTAVQTLTVVDPETGEPVAIVDLQSGEAIIFQFDLSDLEVGKGGGGCWVVVGGGGDGGDGGDVGADTGDAE